MVPDRNLALYTARRTKKEVLYWEGCCNVHDGLSAAEVVACQAAHPDAVFIAHPECRPEVLDLAKEIRSTSGMLNTCGNLTAKSSLSARKWAFSILCGKITPASGFTPLHPTSYVQI
jgi:quinolinate synthase